MVRILTATTIECKPGCIVEKGKASLLLQSLVARPLHRINITYTPRAPQFQTDAMSVSFCCRAKMKGFSPWPGRVSFAALSSASFFANSRLQAALSWLPRFLSTPPRDALLSFPRILLLISIRPLRISPSSC